MARVKPMHFDSWINKKILPGDVGKQMKSLELLQPFYYDEESHIRMKLSHMEGQMSKNHRTDARLSTKSPEDLLICNGLLWSLCEK